MAEERLRQVAAFFDRTDTYLRNRYGIRLRAEMLRELLGPLAVGQSILDIGCGDGSLSLQFLPVARRVTLTDLSGPMLEVAHSRVPEAYQGKVDIRQVNFIDFDPGTPFDLVLCVGVLAHVDSVEQALQKIAALLRPGGYGVLQYTDQSSWLARLKYQLYVLSERSQPHYAYMVNRIWKTQMESLLAGSGLSVLAERRYSFLLPVSGRLPDSWLYRFQRWTLETPLISRFGTDVVLLVQKPAGAGV